MMSRKSKRLLWYSVNHTKCGKQLLSRFCQQM